MDFACGEGTRARHAPVGTKISVEVAPIVPFACVVVALMCRMGHGFISPSSLFRRRRQRQPLSAASRGLDGVCANLNILGPLRASLFCWCTFWPGTDVAHPALRFALAWVTMTPVERVSHPCAQ